MTACAFKPVAGSCQHTTITHSYRKKSSYPTSRTFAFHSIPFTTHTFLYRSLHTPIYNFILCTCRMCSPTKRQKKRLNDLHLSRAHALSHSHSLSPSVRLKAAVEGLVCLVYIFYSYTWKCEAAASGAAVGWWVVWPTPSTPVHHGV